MAVPSTQPSEHNSIHYIVTCHRGWVGPFNDVDFALIFPQKEESSSQRCVLCVCNVPAGNRLVHVYRLMISVRCPD